MMAESSAGYSHCLFLSTLLIHLLFFGNTSNASKCFCKHELANKIYRNLFCTDSDSYDPGDLKANVLCSRIGGHIRILDTAKAKESSENSPKLKASAFAGLNMNDKPSKLQLQLNLQNQTLNSLHFTHMSGLWYLDAKRSNLNLDGCSLATMNNLSRVFLNCDTILPSKFLTIGQNFSDLHFLNCVGKKKQYLCRRCKNDMNKTVIHELPGPQITQRHVRILRQNKDFCQEAICSDEKLCRDNMAYQQAKRFNFAPVGAEVFGGLTLITWIGIVFIIILPLIFIALVYVLIKIAKKSKNNQFTTAMKIEQANMSLPPAEHSKKLPTSLLLNTYSLDEQK